MNPRQRHILFLLTALISLVLLAAPARGSDWFAFQVGHDGIGVGFGSLDWWAYGTRWSDPHVQLSFEQVLGGYGEWLWVGGLGRVWRPWVAAGWTPYHHGRWVLTSAGWTWVAYEPWGYFPHHYGHWAYTSYGWVWVPGYDYRPAAVVWVRWGDYVGWYPCPPNGWSHSARGFRHDYHGGYHHGYNDGYHSGYDDGWREAYWATYVHWNHLSSHDISRHAMSSTAIRRTGTGSDIRLSIDAPSRTEVQQRGVELAPIARLETRTVAVAGRSLTVSRPQGMGPSIQQHARGTVERALAPEVSRRAVGREDVRDTTEVERASPRVSIPIAQGSREDSFDRSMGATTPSGRDTLVSRPSSSLGARDVTAPSPDRAVGRATSTPLQRGSAPPARGSAAEPNARSTGPEHGAPQVRVDGRRAHVTGAPETRAPAARSPAPTSAPRALMREPVERGAAELQAQPRNGGSVSERRGNGTDKPKPR